VARTVSDGATIYGILLGCFGTGAVIGALAMQRARQRWSLDTVASSAVAIAGTAIAALSTVHIVPLLVLVMLVAGAGWIVFISLLNALVQALAPDWARARVLAAFILTSQGGIAAGSAVWGVAATRVGLSTTFLVSGLATIATLLLRAKQ